MRYLSALTHRNKADSLQKQNADNDKELKLCEERERALAREIYNWEKKYNKVMPELQNKIILVEELSSKAEKADQVKSRNEILEKELNFLSNEKVLMDSQLMQMMDERDTANRRLQDEVQKSELLKMDKIYLTKEIEQHNQVQFYHNLSYIKKIQTLQERAERQHKKLKELKKTKEALTQQLLRTKEDGKITHEQRLQAEVEKIRSQTGADLEQIKANAKEVYERELR